MELETNDVGYPVKPLLRDFQELTPRIINSRQSLILFEIEEKFEFLSPIMDSKNNLNKVFDLPSYTKIIENNISNVYGVNTQERLARIEELKYKLGSIALGSMVEFSDDFASLPLLSPGFKLKEDSYYQGFLRKVDTLATQAERERLAHKFRSARMRIGGLGDITRELQDATKAKLKLGVSRVIRRSDDLIEGTQNPGERHRLYTPLVAALYADSRTRELLVDSVDGNVQTESDELKKEAISKDGSMSMDWLVIGSGVHGAIASAELRSLLPEDRIVMVDKMSKMGGQFANYGDRPVFFGNSRSNRKQQIGATELPGYDGNINSFGPHAPVQLPDLTANTYWTNVEMGDAVKLNGYLSAEIMQTTEVSRVEYVRELGINNGYYKVEMTDLDSGKLMTVKVKNIVVTTGLGERIALTSPENQTDGYYSVEDLLARFADKENDFPMDEFVDKSVAVIGGGDSARISLELFSRLAPVEAYGKSTVQFGSGPQSIDWFGVEFEDRDGFSATTRPRYSQLASFIDRKTGDSLIHPKQRTKVTGVEPSDDGRLTVYYKDSNGNESSEVYDCVIDATTLVSKVTDPFDSIEGNPIPIIGKSIETKIGTDFRAGNTRTIGKQLSGHRIVSAGPVAKSPLTNKEQATFAMGIRENTAAIWANSPRTVELMQRMAGTSRKII